MWNLEKQTNSAKPRRSREQISGYQRGMGLRGEQTRGEGGQLHGDG